MSYKGEDLDLRTPAGVGAVSGRATFDPPGNGTNRYQNGSGIGGSPHVEGPIWVDDILLACCNHAFDVAFAHRAAEVRIEHLLYAVTRVDAASEVLESSGIRDAGLRRESAMVIASGIPALTTSGSTRPLVSAAFGEAVRLASAHSAGYNRAAGISDLIYIFTVLRPDLPGLDLLRRHMNAIPATQASNTQSQVFSSPSTTADPTVIMTPNNSSSDMVQDKRLEAIEVLMRSLGHDLSLGRQSHGDGGYSPSVGGQAYSNAPAPIPVNAQPVATTGNDQVSPQVGAKLEFVSSHLNRMEQQLVSLEKLVKNGSIAGVDLSPLDARLNDIELALLSQDGSVADGKGLDARFVELSEDFEQSLEKLNQNTSSQIASVHNELSSERAALGAEIKALAGASATHAASAERNLSVVKDALGDIDEKVSKIEGENLETRGKFVDDLREVHDAIMKLNANQHTLAESITNWHKDHVSDLDVISERLASIEENTSKPLDELKVVSSNVAELASNMDVMYRANIERYHRRNRFWFWLFGTDDWVGASWPSQTARIEDELRVLKSRRDKD